MSDLLDTGSVFSDDEEGTSNTFGHTTPMDDHHRVQIQAKSKGT
jgi:hypothetical protein